MAVLVAPAVSDGGEVALAVPLPMALGDVVAVADCEAEFVAEPVTLGGAVREVVAMLVAVALAVRDREAVEVPVAEALAVRDRVAVELPEAVAEGVQEWSTVEPGGQSRVQPQGAHVAMKEAPSAAEKVPAGHSVGFREEQGQYAPAGQMTGAPEEQ